MILELSAGGDGKGSSSLGSHFFLSPSSKPPTLLGHPGRCAVNVLTKCVLARGGIQIEEGLTDREREREGREGMT